MKRGRARIGEQTDRYNSRTVAQTVAGIIKYATAARLIQFVGKKVLKLRETE
jgi:hypothetical protein